MSLPQNDQFRALQSVIVENKLIAKINRNSSNRHPHPQDFSILFMTTNQYGDYSPSSCENSALQTRTIHTNVMIETVDLKM